MQAEASVGGGVFETDAPDGYVGIVVRDSSNALVMRIEIAEERYSPEMIPPLRAWVHAHSRPAQMSLVR